MRRRLLLVPVLIVLTGVACQRGDDAARMTELQRARSGNLDVVLLSVNDGLRQGKDMFVLEFRATSDQHLVDVGTVRANATMPMPGAPMFGSVDIQPAEVSGRYAATGDFSMAGTWRFSVEWDGPAGRGSVTFPGTVR